VFRGCHPCGLLVSVLAQVFLALVDRETPELVEREIGRVGCVERMEKVEKGALCFESRRVQPIEAPWNRS
jgi:hypothetical protein